MFLSLTLIQSKKVWPRPRADVADVGPSVWASPSCWPLCRCWHERISAVGILCCWLDVLLVHPGDLFHCNFIWISLKKGFQKTIRYRNQGALGLNFRSNFENSDSPKNAWTEKTHMLYKSTQFLDPKSESFATLKAWNFKFLISLQFSSDIHRAVPGVHQPCLKFLDPTRWSNCSGFC